MKKDTKYPEKGLYETRYFPNANMSDPKRAMSRGFPWSEKGNIEGAAKAVAKGLVAKVQSINRETGDVRWTVKRKPKVRGCNIFPYDVIPGDDK